MYQTLYRKYRPSTFDEIVGQKVVVQTLKNAIKNNHLNHAYLFTGPRGTGKTSVAKILAKTINCHNLNNCVPCGNCESCIQNQSTDIVEIDAASNNGVDEIRELKSKVNLVPSYGKYKIYIIDEVHMLTTGAFNALLKTLEEPPDHIVFVLATTEPHKIPATILSRCQRFDFKKINTTEIYERLKYISQQENISIDDSALIEISQLSDGGLRDALSLLDQVIAYAENKITIEDIHEINGTISPNQIKEFLNTLFQKNTKKIFDLINYYDLQGKDFIKLTEEIILFLRNILLTNYISDLSNEIYNNIEISMDEIINYVKIFNESIQNMKNSNNPKIVFEIAIIERLFINSKNEITVTSKLQKEDNNIETKIDNITIEENISELNKESINEDFIKKVCNIRINNTLCNFNKKIYISWKEKISYIESYVIDSKYGKYASLILDGTLKAASNDHLIFIYDNKSLSELFNKNLYMIDQLFEEIFHEKICTISTNEQQWENIKTEFNNKTKVYQYIDENFDLSKNLMLEEDELETTFGSIIEYE